MYFKLEKLTSEVAIGEIRSCITSVCSHVDESKQKLEAEYVKQMIDRINTRQYSYRGFLRVPDNDPELIKRVIGKSGHFFYLTTEKNQLDFIWYERTTHQFLFWGDKPNLIRAMSIMLNRLQSKVDAIC